MKEIYQKIVELFHNDTLSVLATIIRQSGPSPRGIGTKCLIMQDGSFIGTIGGGVVEAKTIKAAMKVFDTGIPVRLTFSLKGSDVADTDMLCGGDMEVFLEPVAPKYLSYLSILEKVIKITGRGGAGLLATVINENLWQQDVAPKIFLEKKGKPIGSLLGGRAMEDALIEKIDGILNTRLPLVLSLQDDSGNQVEIFAEPIIADPFLYVFGGGHVSSQIVPLASRVGFQVVVIDDRQEFADIKNFPDARDVHQFPFDGVMDKLSVDKSSYLVIVTRGHVHDKNVLAQALKTDARYIGMIGSTRKRNIIYEKLIEEGFTKEELNRVHSPIGLEIGAETPEEIAVSIVAELIMIRAGMD
jgi:xanthine dehydrogenase accessory factor